MVEQAIPDWFSNAVLDGIERLYVLSLAGTPGADTIAYTHQVWTEALWHGKAWDEVRDATRIAVAFQRLAHTADRWPAPRELLAVLPKADTQHSLPLRISPEQRQRNRERLREIMQEVDLRGG